MALIFRCLWCTLRVASDPPPPLCPNTGLSKHTSGPLFPHFWAFWNHHLCSSNPIENVVCGFVRASRRVNVGGKVVVYVLLCFGVYAGLLDPLL